jgi:hypothetical protein
MFKMIMILNIISIISGAISTVLGLSDNKKWDGGGPTRHGWKFIVLLLITVISQVYIQYLNDLSRREAENRSASYEEIVQKAYSGWIGIGIHDDKTWIQYNIGGDEKEIDDINPNSFAVIGNGFINYLWVRTKYPENCLNEKFKNETKYNVLARGVTVEFVEVKIVPCADGTTELWAKVRPVVR